MATKKKFKKMLQRLAETMPTIMEQTHEEHVVNGSELISQGHVDNGKGGKIIPEKSYKQKMPVLIARNHINHLKRAYKSNGRDGVSSYVNEVKSILNCNI